MSSPVNTILVLSLSAGFFLPILNSPLANADLQAGGVGTPPLVDSDADGLDDALEYRFGTDPLEFDLDGDTLSDLEEFLLGTDPHSHGAPPPGQIEPRLFGSGYAVGDSFVFEMYALRRYNTEDVQLRVATESLTLNVQLKDAYAWVVDHDTRDATFAKGTWFVDRLRFRLHRSAVLYPSSLSLGAIVRLDGIHLYEDFHVVNLRNGKGKLLGQAEFRFDWVQSRGAGSTGGAHKQQLQDSVSFAEQGSGSSTTGGGTLLPLEPLPTETPPPSGTVGEVCSQTVDVVGAGNGTVRWRVIAAECVPADGTPPPICFSSCPSTIDEEFTTVDIVGWLGG